MGILRFHRDRRKVAVQLLAKFADVDRCLVRGGRRVQLETVGAARHGADDLMMKAQAVEAAESRRLLDQQKPQLDLVAGLFQAGHVGGDVDLVALARDFQTDFCLGVLFQALPTNLLRLS